MSTLKRLQKYTAQAKQIEKVDPLIAYYCNLYVVKQALGISNRSAEDNAMLNQLMGYLEEHKQHTVGVSPDEALDRVSSFALKVFAAADDSDHKANPNWKKTAMTFRTAFLMMDVATQFDNVPQEVIQKNLYAKAKCASILKALKAGETPKSGGFVEEENDETMPMDFGNDLPAIPTGMPSSMPNGMSGGMSGGMDLPAVPSGVPSSAMDMDMGFGLPSVPTGMPTAEGFPPMFGELPSVPSGMPTDEGTPGGTSGGMSDGFSGMPMDGFGLPSVPTGVPSFGGDEDEEDLRKPSLSPEDALSAQLGFPSFPSAPNTLPTSYQPPQQPSQQQPTPMRQPAPSYQQQPQGLMSSVASSMASMMGRGGAPRAPSQGGITIQCHDPGDSILIAQKETERMLKHALTAVRFDDIGCALGKLHEALAIIYPWKDVQDEDSTDDEEDEKQPAYSY